jgi:hypothetical protein
LDSNLAWKGSIGFQNCAAKGSRIRNLRLAPQKTPHAIALPRIGRVIGGLWPPFLLLKNADAKRRLCGASRMGRPSQGRSRHPTRLLASPGAALPVQGRDKRYFPIALSRNRIVRAQAMAAASALKLARASLQKPCWRPDVDLAVGSALLFDRLDAGVDHPPKRRQPPFPSTSLRFHRPAKTLP